MEAVNIYLAALLEDIPHERIQKTFASVNARPDILRLANQYASANNLKKENAPDFVASPFENLKKTSSDYAYRFPVQELNLKNDFFPRKKNEIVEEKTVEELWAAFEADFQNCALGEDLRRTAERTLNYLCKYAVTIPNPAGVFPEISWYDYVKTKSGLAVSLFAYTEEKGSANLSDEDKPILIIRADVSGIQNFITSIASKNASKNLKGRSFYVQLLADVVLRKMLRSLGLFQGNVLYASGGNFFILAPNTAFVRNAFSTLEKKLTEAIFNEHGTSISIVMGSQEVTQHQILNGEIDEAIKLLFEEKIDVLKKQKYAGLMASNYERFFLPMEEGGKSATDMITGEEIGSNKGMDVYRLSDDNPLPERAAKEEIEIGENLLKESTAKQIFLGHSLKDSNYLVLSESAISCRKKDWGLNPCRLGTHICIEKKLSHELQEDVEIFAINGLDLMADGRCLDGFMLYGGNRVPVLPDSYESKSTGKRQKGDPVYFHEMSAKDYYKKSGDSESVFKRLGVLRMDVDGLGSIFKNQLPYPAYEKKEQRGEKRAHLSFAMYASLSRNLDWFFKGYLNSLWAEDEDLRNYTQIIYSGGDDLFVIGRWDLAISFAEKIKDAFAAFTCFSGVTISGGVAIVTDKYPIMKAGAMAGAAEHEAKSHSLKEQDEEGRDKIIFEKNSITLLGKPLHWDTEYRLVKSLKEDLLKYLSKDKEGKLGIPRSLLGKIRMHYYLMNQFEMQKIKGLKANPRWIWLATYDFSRFAGRLRSDQKSFIKKLAKKIGESSKDEIRKIYEAEKMSAEQMDFLNKIKRGIFTNTYKSEAGENLLAKSNYHFMELLNIAARWAELTLRSKLGPS